MSKSICRNSSEGTDQPKSARVSVALIFLFLLSFNVFGYDKHTLDLQTSSFYTGCIDGWIVSYEAGWYVRPKNKTGKEVFEQLKKTCKKKTEIYRKELLSLEAKDPERF